MHGFRLWNACHLSISPQACWLLWGYVMVKTLHVVASASHLLIPCNVAECLHCMNSGTSKPGNFWKILSLVESRFTKFIFRIRRWFFSAREQICLILWLFGTLRILRKAWMFYCYKLETQTQWQICIIKSPNGNLCQNTIWADESLQFFRHFEGIFLDFPETGQSIWGSIYLTNTWPNMNEFKHGYSVELLFNRTFKQKSVFR